MRIRELIEKFFHKIEIVRSHMKLETCCKDLEKILSTQYDVILNGYELGGGSVRTHKPEMLFKIFQILGYSDENINTNFGHIIQAFKFGVPPHGGIAWGFDRLMMLLQNEPNIREVIAFPKTGEGRDLMMQSPSAVSDEQLRELRLKIKGQEENK
jgi:aspartyl-tRNA synthetase